MQVSELADVLTLVGGPVPVDIVFDRIPGGLEFAGLKSRSVEIAVGSQTIRVAALEDIVRSKKVADRPKDRAQLPILEQSLAVLKKLK